ncbi:hypothetical protein [Christiangramia aquimixticola]|uniref:hypothetical protein n=1 Tax=Christiangramia aquimixticola TaxID=1697558 RepID=UPI003AA95C80
MKNLNYIIANLVLTLVFSGFNFIAIASEIPAPNPEPTQATFFKNDLNDKAVLLEESQISIPVSISYLDAEIFSGNTPALIVSNRNLQDTSGSVKHQISLFDRKRLLQCGIYPFHNFW